jgi:Pyridoxamine 5'-phosphate oxidase
MTARTPAAAEPPVADTTATPWAEARVRLQNPERERTSWLATERLDGWPHVMPLLGLWLDDAFYFITGETTRKGKYLTGDPRCVLTTSSTTLPELDLILEREARKVTDEATLQHVAEVYRTMMDWPLEVREGRSSVPMRLRPGHRRTPSTSSRRRLSPAPRHHRHGAGGRERGHLQPHPLAILGCNPGSDAHPSQFKHWGQITSSSARLRDITPSVDSRSGRSTT